MLDELEHFHMMYGGMGDARRVLTNRPDVEIFARQYILWRGNDIPKDDSRKPRDLRHLPTSVKMRAKVIYDRCVFQVSSRDLREDGSYIEGSYKNHGVVLAPMGDEWEEEHGFEEAIRSADGDFFIHFHAKYEAQVEA